MIPPRPSVPTPFVAGTVRIPAGQPVSLLQLIQEQINRDCPGTSTQLCISSDPCNQAPVYFGAFMANSTNDPLKPGRLSTLNYGRLLTPMGEPIEYRSSFPGTQSPIGVLQVFSEAPAKIHIIAVE